MKLENVLRVREILFDLQNRLSTGINPVFVSYNIRCMGTDKKEIIDALCYLNCIRNVSFLGQTYATFTADYDAVCKALTEKLYDNI